MNQIIFIIGFNAPLFSVNIKLTFKSKLKVTNAYGYS